MKTGSRIVVALGLLAAGAALAQAAADGISPADTTAMIASCAACHGSAGEGNEARSAPRLAGLDRAYLERQLDLFASGMRGTGQGDRFGSQMYVIAQSLRPADRKAAAIHYASAAATPPPRTLVASDQSNSGKQAFETCAACHGEDGMGNSDISAPRIAGQADWYVLRSLETYHARARGYDETDMAGRQMGIALEAVDPAHFKAITAYVATLAKE